MKIIALTGMAGSGKEEAKRFILKTRKMPTMKMSSVVEAEMEEKGLPLTNESIRNYATEIRKEHGYDIVAKMCVPVIKKDKTDFFLIDGVRGLPEIEVFKEEFGDDFSLVAIHSSPKTRFDRLKKRGRHGDMDEWNEFVFRDKKELGWGLGDVIALADYVVINEGALDELESQVKVIMKKILG